MKKRILNCLIIIIATAVFYFVLLLPSQYLFRLYVGTEVRISIVISMVGGIVFGWPCAIGVFIGNLVYDLIYNFSSEYAYLIVIGSLFNGLACLGNRYLFKLINKKRKDIHLHDIRGLVSYISSILVINLVLSAVVSALLLAYSSTNYWEAFLLTFLNNAEFSILLGIPLMLYTPFIFKLDFENVNGIKERTFRWIVTLSIITSLVITTVFGCVLFSTGLDQIGKWRRLFLFAALIVVINSISFSCVNVFVFKNLTNPIHNLAKDVKNDDDRGNELDILSSKLNFVASNKSKLQGNQFDLYVGLTTIEGKQVAVNDAKEIINAICLKYVDGFISEEGNGGYKGDETNFNDEKVLIYTIFGATDQQINNIVNEILIELSQESILVEKNKVNRWYIHR